MSKGFSTKEGTLGNCFPGFPHWQSIHTKAKLQSLHIPSPENMLLLPHISKSANLVRAQPLLSKFKAVW